MNAAQRAGLSLAALLSLTWAPAARSVVFTSTGDPAANTSTPGDNSGWQYQGTFNAYLGTPVAARYFLTAAHIGQGVGQVFTFHGETFTTVATVRDPAGTDLQLWQVDHDFPTWTPLYTGDAETGQELRVFGRGTQRGNPIARNGATIGWLPGTSDHVQRWGRNVVTGFDEDGQYLTAAFDYPGVNSEAHLTVGDSGGAVFVSQDGLWKLAAINYGVDDLYTGQAASTQVVAPIFDARGYYAKVTDADTPDSFVLITGDTPVPTKFYSTRVSPRLAWIQSVIGRDPAALPPETFTGWLHGYFNADQFNNDAVTGPNADPDGDGVTNLLEFAFNLDPAHAEPLVLAPGTGIRGLPLVRLETLAATGDTRLTVEYLRRTAAGGGGISYAVQFAGDLSANAVPSDTWQAASGTETVTAINTRWERVKIADSLPMTSAGRRFARVVVTLATSAAGTAATPAR